ncbi:MAG: competence protein ComEA [Frankiaceae bacterium]|nr:competence protein ComEA [Frankiaceae bacterium]
MRTVGQPAAPDALDRLTTLLAGPEPAGVDVASPEGVVPGPVARASRPMVLDAAVVRVLAGLVALSIVAAAVAGFLFFRGRPGAIAAPRPALSMSGSALGAGGSPGSGSPSGSASSGTIVVAVEGKVRKPGVVRLPAGSRVIDAVAAAGGAVPGTDLATVNLAAKLSDGQQIVVGGSTVGSAPGADGATPSGPLNLNQASAGQLDGLPGVGPVTAERIVAWRTAHGGFQRLDQLQDVPGIGPSKFTQLRDLVTL